MQPFHLFLLNDGRVVPHSSHGDWQQAVGEYQRVAEAQDAALVQFEGGEITAVTASRPFIQSDPAFVKAVKRALGAPERAVGAPA